MSHDQEQSDEPSAVTVLALALFRLGLPADYAGALTGADFERARLPMMGGCQLCGATVAAYNSCPTRSGFIACDEHTTLESGWTTVDEANRALFPEEYTWRGLS